LLREPGSPEGLMKLCRASLYALRAVAHLARHGEDRPFASHAVAKATGVPALFLLRVLRPRAGANVLHSLKDPTGATT
jgi:DNA-binding IscR family transcriptional regulator